ncbi:MAG: nicotinamide-nucleotide amidohydrolase family protein [Actinomycetales bacterium]|nr:nicotinamide-nucleotide amidohydrolase family protein [Actinomycetales bacterium]
MSAAGEEPGVAERVVALLRDRGESLAVAESLTGGLVCARVVDVAGASAVLRGGVVCYATDLKRELLGVDAALLARVGPVDADVAAQLAEGVRRLLGGSWGISTTGVAGPGPADGHPQGTVHVAVAGPAGIRTLALSLPGTRDAVRSAAAGAVLDLLLRAAGELPSGVAPV